MIVINRICVAAVLMLVSMSARADDCTTACTGAGGPVRVFRIVNGIPVLRACHAAGADVVIDASLLSGAEVLYVTGCDGSPPSAAIGRIRVTGDSPFLTSLMVAVVGLGTPVADLDNNTRPLERAGSTLAGLVVEQATVRSKTRTSISVTDTIDHNGNPADPDIHVNQVVRVQTPSSIAANIVATGEGPTFLSGDAHIGQIRAGVGISGSITSANGDIFAVRVLNVDPLPTAEGITGDIIAKGNIGTIYSTGPIGPEGSIDIFAGRRIEQIRTIAESQQDTVLPLSAVARIGTGMDITTGQPDASLVLTGNSAADAPLGLLEVGGSFAGRIDAANVAPLPGLPDGKNGILITGDVIEQSQINVQFNLDHSKIIARNFTLGAGVNIGLRMTGVIVEYGRDLPDPVLGPPEMFINIGMGTPPPQYEGQAVGMTGSNCPPVNMTLADWWFATPDCDGINAAIPTTYDSLIRVDKLKGLNISRMTLETAPDVRKSYIPRVEALFSSDVIIGSLEAGVVWSGDMSLEDPYLEFGSGNVRFNCVSPTADAWLRYGVQASTIDITNDLLGELHLPLLASEDHVRIGEKLGDRREEQCGCGTVFGTTVPACPGQGDVTCKYPCASNGPNEQNGQEVTPRTFEGGVQLAPIGRVIVTDDDGLAGQITLNATTTYEREPDGSNALDFWRGRVDVAPEYVLSPIIPAIPTCDPEPEVFPVHRAGVSDYGHGDAGQIPFRVHYESCKPPSQRYCPESETRFVTAQALASTSVPAMHIRYDGPLAFNAGAGKPARVFGLDSNWEYTVDRTQQFSFAVDPLHPNVLTVSGTSSVPTVYVVGHTYGTQYFKIVPNTDVASTSLNPLLCDPATLLVSVPIAVSDETFEFGVIFDCNGNSIADPDEIANSPMGMADCNGNHRLDTCEIADDPSLDSDHDGILNSCEGSSAACTINGHHVKGDFNCSGTITVQDIFDFLTAYFGNSSSADVNHSGSVSVQDIFDYIAAYFAGCPCVP